MKTDWTEVLAGLAIFLVAMALLAALVLTGWSNNQKVQEMTRLCVEQGYDGWAGEDWSDNGSGCTE